MAGLATRSRAVMTDRKLGSQLETFCSQYGIPLPFQTEFVRDGRNSRVCRISHGTSRWILKNYHQPPGAKRDRLGTEYKFLAFLNDLAVTNIPQALGMDRAALCALYSFLPGHRPDVVTATHITQAANFIRTLNRFRDDSEALKLPLAADACLSWQEHLTLVDARIQRLMDMEPASEMDAEAYAFVKHYVQPRWSVIHRSVLHTIASSDLMTPLPLAERILSPSDFGFHNTLEYEGRISFVDFEYAGWDDPAKLICDFFCQPELPVTLNQGLHFMEEILDEFTQPESIRRRVRALLPVHRLKWCCILLNEFRQEDRERRVHAGVQLEGLLSAQMRKAKMYFDEHLSELT